MNAAFIDWTSYVEAMAAVQQLPLDAERRTEVVAQMVRIEALAKRFVDFPLEAALEPALVFRP